MELDLGSVMPYVPETPKAEMPENVMQGVRRLAASRMPWSEIFGADTCAPLPMSAFLEKIGSYCSLIDDLDYRDGDVYTVGRHFEVEGMVDVENLMKVLSLSIETPVSSGAEMEGNGSDESGLNSSVSTPKPPSAPSPGSTPSPLGSARGAEDDAEATGTASEHQVNSVAMDAAALDELFLTDEVESV